MAHGATQARRRYVNLKRALENSPGLKQDEGQNIAYKLVDTVQDMEEELADAEGDVEKAPTSRFHLSLQTRKQCSQGKW